MKTNLDQKAAELAARDAWKEGRTFFEDAAIQSPSDPLAHAHLGFFVVKESRYDTRRGIAELDAALQLDPSCSMAYIYKAVILAYLKEYSQAVQTVRSAVKSGASPEFVLWAAGCVELEAGSVEKATEHFQRLVELRPTSGNMISLSKAYSQSGFLEKAMEWARNAVAADPSDFRTYVYEGIYLAYLKRYREAREALSKAESLNGRYALLQHTWAYVENAEGNAGAAEERLRKALEIDPDYVTSQKMLADLCAESGRRMEARGLYSAALALFPDYTEAKRGLEALEKEG